MWCTVVQMKAKPKDMCLFVLQREAMTKRGLLGGDDDDDDDADFSEEDLIG